MIKLEFVNPSMAWKMFQLIHELHSVGPCYLQHREDGKTGFFSRIPTIREHSTLRSRVIIFDKSYQQGRAGPSAHRARTDAPLRKQKFGAPKIPPPPT